VTAHRLTREQARRVAVRAQRLGAARPGDLHDVVRALTLLQLDPTEAIAPSADLVAQSRLGPAYDPAELRAALEKRPLIELRAMIRPAEDIALYRADMAAWDAAERGQIPGWRPRSGTGYAPTTPAGAICSPGWPRPVRCPPGSCRTAAPCPGGPAAGPTTAT
jgi:uncharacterized protein YcaQ